MRKGKRFFLSLKALVYFGNSLEVTIPKEILLTAENPESLLLFVNAVLLVNVHAICK